MSSGSTGGRKSEPPGDRLFIKLFNDVKEADLLGGKHEGTSAPAAGGAPVFGEPADHLHRVHVGQEVSFFSLNFFYNMSNLC